MDVIEKQLQYLNETMKDKSSEIASFLMKYYLGGIIAVIALLNIDLVALGGIKITNEAGYYLLGVVIVLVLTLSHQYFKYVLSNYAKLSKSHRKIKYKFEITLHYAMSTGEYKDYQYYLEQSLDKKPETPDKDYIKKPEQGDYDFNYIGEYFLNHHRVRFHEIEAVDKNYLRIGLLVVCLTLAIRGIFIVIESLG